MGEYDSAGTLLRSYIHGPGIDEPIRMTDHSTSASYYYLADGLGSITQIQDVSKNIVESYIYDSFGTPKIKDSTGTTITQSAIGNPYMFTGREWDSETQLYYYRARYYNTSTGRFISEDPLLKMYNYKGKHFNSKPILKYNPKVFNSYNYCYNNPANFKDPSGLIGWGTICRALCWAGYGACVAAAIYKEWPCPPDAVDLENCRLAKDACLAHCPVDEDDFYPPRIPDPNQEYVPGYFYPPVPTCKSCVVY